MKIDITKKYRTRDGRDAVIHATDGPRDGYPVIASVASPGAIGGWVARDFSDQGIHASGEIGELDLIEVRDPREGWVAAHQMCSTAAASAAFSGTTRVIQVREIID